MSTNTDTSSDIRGRLLDAAQRCFYRDGITATGVDTLAAEAGVSKRTLYNHFGSKQGLVTAYLQRREEWWRERLGRWLDQAGDDPVERIVAHARAYADFPFDEEFRGCAFINAAAEVSDETDPSLGVVRESLAHIEDGLREELVRAGISPAEPMATQILLILEGAITVAGVRRSYDPFRAAEEAIRALLSTIG